jgi:TetR/AcrR family transcriptional repressor of nem operon
MDELRSTIRHILTRGMERGEIRPGIDADAWASAMIATLEGAEMMHKLYQDPAHLRRAIEHIRDWIARDLVPL